MRQIHKLTLKPERPVFVHPVKTACFPFKNKPRKIIILQIIFQRRTDIQRNRKFKTPDIRLKPTPSTIRW